MDNIELTHDNIVLYRSEDGKVNVDVILTDETVWVTQDQMTLLFSRDKSTISRHIKNIFEDGELDENSVVAFFATTAADGKTYNVAYYNLDVIISVGYRVHSVQGTRFRAKCGSWNQTTTKRFANYHYLVKINPVVRKNRITKETKANQ
ncbi:MAG: virulence RhuM family protein [Paludibacteraceae bacterium]|nr:virulence RhuM family protein [Paludibacteraceae bacterium]